MLYVVCRVLCVFFVLCVSCVGCVGCIVCLCVLCFVLCCVLWLRVVYCLFFVVYRVPCTVYCVLVDRSDKWKNNG